MICSPVLHSLAASLAGLLLGCSEVVSAAQEPGEIATTTAAAPQARSTLAPTIDDDGIPGPIREFRAAWVATVANIDWPSQPGLAPAVQRKEAIAILDRLVALRMNAVIFQVRPHADALYASELEPWSAYLTGNQGRAPSPLYDPLEFWIEQAHARGLELHAWFNPYRVCHPAHPGKLSRQSIALRRPDLVRTLGKQGYRWMDPALDAVQRHSLEVVRDVVRRYDVDAVHFDDYFYPYRSYNDGKDFPDDASYAAYTDGGGTLGRKAWRRAAVNRFVEGVAHEIKKLKPHVRFGISPFGIWRPGHPRGIEGLDQYDVLFADAKLWWNEGQVDYLAPQLYWPIAQAPQSFPVLLSWWQQENRASRHLWPGISLRKPRTTEGATEVASKVFVARGMLGSGTGVCMFSMKSLMDPACRVADALTRSAFRTPALVPATTWIDATKPTAPRAKIERRGKSLAVTWKPRGGESAWLFVVYEERDGRWSHRILNGQVRGVEIDDKCERVIVTAVDRLGNESERHVMPTAR